MEDVLQQSYAPAVMVAASPDCAWIYEHPLLKSNGVVTASSGLSVRLCGLPQLAANAGHAQLLQGPDVSALVTELKKSDQDFYFSTVRELASATFAPQRAQAFETIGHPVACILVVSSENPSPISALTQLYQQSYFDCPPGMSADFLRCVWYIHKESSSETDEDGAKGPAEDFATVASQFGPHCFEVADSETGVHDAVQTVATHSIYPYMHKVIKEWQLASAGRGSRGFGFGKLLKKLVANGPARPDTNVFFDVCREMQPHVASIPARRRPNSSLTGLGSTGSELDLDMQLRRLADFAFLLKDYRLAYSAYESLRKPFSAEQRWAHLGSCCEMAAVTGAITGLGDVGAAVDTALYTYDSRLHLPGHVLRCVLIVCGCLVEYGDQLLAAGLLSTTLIEIDPVFGSGDEPAETAMLMERISVAFDKRGWHRKSKLWAMLAEREWSRVPV